MGRLSLLPICVLFFLTFSFFSLRGCDKLIETRLPTPFYFGQGKKDHIAAAASVQKEEDHPRFPFFSPSIFSRERRVFCCPGAGEGEERGRRKMGEREGCVKQKMTPSPSSHHHHRWYHGAKKCCRGKRQLRKDLAQGNIPPQVEKERGAN